MSNTTAPAHAWRVAVLAGMASYLDAGILVVSGVAIGSLYADSMDLSNGMIGLILGLQTVMLAVGALIGGRAGDLIGRRRVFTASLSLLTVGAVCLAVAPNAEVLLLGSVLSGLAIGADLPASLAMINEEAPEGSKGRMVAFSDILWGVGILVSGVLGAIFAGLEETGARILYGHIAVVAVVVLAFRLSVRESAEWTAARSAAEASASNCLDVGPVRFAVSAQLLRGPVLAAVLATGIFYATWGVGANTLGQFGSYLWENLAGGEVASWPLVGVVALPLALVAGLVFLVYVDTGLRRHFVLAGTLMTVTAWALPLVFGVTRPVLVAVMLVFLIGSAVAGETMYKVWSQELVPTLLRTSAQGVTLAVNRVVAALAAFATPWLASNHPTILFAAVFGLMIISAVAALAWIPRLPLATCLEQPVVVVTDQPTAR